jgi:glycosyltransferase involved in cell wall biosynthesis
VASEAGGSVELFESGYDALGYLPGDVDGLAACIDKLVRDARLRKKLALQGRASVLSRFDRASLADELVPLYLKAARKAG